MGKTNYINGVAVSDIANDTYFGPPKPELDPEDLLYLKEHLPSFKTSKNNNAFVILFVEINNPINMPRWESGNKIGVKVYKNGWGPSYRYKINNVQGHGTSIYESNSLSLQVVVEQLKLIIPYIQMTTSGRSMDIKEVLDLIK